MATAIVQGYLEFIYYNFNMANYMTLKPIKGWHKFKVKQSRSHIAQNGLGNISHFFLNRVNEYRTQNAESHKHK